MAHARDYQRENLYKWERKYHSNKMMTLVECEELVARVFQEQRKNYRPNFRRSPKIGDGRGRRIACAEIRSHKIKLPLWARMPEVVLHEIAHLLIPPTEDTPAHGKEFLDCMINLWGAYAGYDVEAMRTSAREAGLKV
jgi:hypothetical protein